MPSLALLPTTTLPCLDKEFEVLARGIGAGRYAFVVLDAWTWAAKGWVPKVAAAHRALRPAIPSSGPSGAIL